MPWSTTALLSSPRVTADYAAARVSLVVGLAILGPQRASSTFRVAGGALLLVVISGPATRPGPGPEKRGSGSCVSSRRAERELGSKTPACRAPARVATTVVRDACLSRSCRPRWCVVNENSPGLVSVDGVDDDARVAAVSRLHDLVSGGGLSVERFSVILEQVFAAASHAELEAAMSALPSLVRLTPASQRLTRPLVLHVPDGVLELGSGWQLAADTAVETGFGAARLDLGAASWDVDQINLYLQTWGSIEVLVPKGVAVQMLGGSASVELDSLSLPVPGGPVLRIATSGPTGVIRIRHPKKRSGRPFTRWRRRHRRHLRSLGEHSR